MSQREYLEGPVPLTIDERQRKWSEAYAANIRRVLDRILRRPLTAQGSKLRADRGSRSHAD
jgi:hypothetical protein